MSVKHTSVAFSFVRDLEHHPLTAGLFDLLARLKSGALSAIEFGNPPGSGGCNAGLRIELLACAESFGFIVSGPNYVAHFDRSNLDGLLANVCERVMPCYAPSRGDAIRPAENVPDRAAIEESQARFFGVPRMLR